MWSLNYPSCLWCGTLEVKHKANGLCRGCYYRFYNNEYEKRHIDFCCFCNEKRVISTRKDNKIICKRCYKKYFFKNKRRICYFCRKLARIDKRIDTIDICSTCYDKIKPRPKRLCSICNEFEESWIKKDKKFVCKYCYNTIRVWSKKQCVKCSKIKKISKIFEEGPFCQLCYKKRRRIYYTALAHVRRARKLENGGSLSEREVQIILERDICCVYCGSRENLSLDHVVPISKKGKSDFSNMVLACMGCNMSRRDTDVLMWCKRQKKETPQIVKNLLELQLELKRVEGETFAKSVELPSVAPQATVLTVGPHPP